MRRSEENALILRLALAAALVPFIGRISADRFQKVVQRAWRPYVRPREARECKLRLRPANRNERRRRGCAVPRARARAERSAVAAAEPGRATEAPARRGGLELA